MNIKGVKIPYEEGFWNIYTNNGVITRVEQTNFSSEENLLVFPGLINMHDHLAFNIFPQWKSRTYNNYLDWSKDLHTTFQDEIEKLLTIPYSARCALGEIKNIVQGFTTVCDHEKLEGTSCVIDIFGEYNYLHSLQTEPFWKWKLFFSRNSYPWIIHLNEGFDQEIDREIYRWNKWNIRKRKTIAIHGISINEKQSEMIDALTICLDSNKFLYEKLPDSRFINKITMLWGSDSSLSSNSNLWDQVSMTRDYLSNNRRLYNMLTTKPGELFQSLNDRGSLRVGQLADYIISNSTTFEEVSNDSILAVIKNGLPVIVKEKFKKQLNLDINKSHTLIKTMNMRVYVTNKLIKPLKHVNLPDIIPINIEFCENR